MNALSIGSAPTMTSREIAELVDSRHDKVKQSIVRLFERGVISLPPMGEYLDSMGRSAGEYLIGKRDSYIIVAQLSPEFTARLVDRWQELEAGLAPKLPQTMAQALRLAAEQAEEIERQAEQLALAAPKVEFVDRYVTSTGNKGFREVCKLLGVKEPVFREFLKEKRIMYKLGGVWTAHQAHIDAGRFEIKTGTADHGDTAHAFNQAKFTPKGVEWVAGEWAKHSIKGAS